MTPELILAINRFTALASDLGLSTKEGNPKAVAAQLRALLDEINREIDAEPTFIAREAVAKRQASKIAKEDEERRRRRSVSAGPQPEGIVPQMRPWEDCRLLQGKG